MEKKKAQANGIFKNYFITYFIVLLIPMVITCIYYGYMLFMINDDDIDSRKDDLVHTAARFDTVVSEVNYLGDLLITNTEVNRIKRYTSLLEYPNAYRIYELQDALPDLYLVNQAVYDYFIFFNNSRVVANKSIAYSYDQFYSLYLSKEGLDDITAWEKDLLSSYGHYGFWPMERYNDKKNKTQENFLAYSRPIPAVGPGCSGYIYIFLKEEVLEEMMPTLEKDCIQVVQDMSGNILYRKAESGRCVCEEEVNALFASLEDTEDVVQKKVSFHDQKYTLISYRSPDSGIRYSCFVPMSIINERASYCLLMLAIFIIVGILADVGLSYHISMRNATPINDILNRKSLEIEKLGGHQSAFSSLKTVVGYLADSNDDLSEALNNQKPYLRTAFVNRLLFSGFQEDKDIAGMASYLDCPLEKRVFCVLLFRFHMLMEEDKERDQKLLNTFSGSLSELIEQRLPGSLYTVMGEGQFALILNTEETMQEAIREMACQIVSDIKEKMAPAIAQKVFVYGGSIEHSADQIHESYRNASYLCYTDEEQIENTIIWYDEENTHAVSYPSADMQTRLIHYVTSGDEQGLHDYLEGIVKEYFIDSDLPAYLQQMLVMDLQTTLFRLLSLVKLDNKTYGDYYAQLEQNHNMPILSQISGTVNLFRDLCHSMNKQKTLQDADMIEGGIVAYIDAHYGEQTLSLASVADEFHISQSYLSSLFKQTQGINFSTYIENIRIDKAKELLKTTDLSITRISEMVGYGSTNSFCRAFKRVTHLNTSEYRKD